MSPLAITRISALLLVALFALSSISRAGLRDADSSKVYGRIQFVDSFPDVKVRVVTSLPTLKVQLVHAFPKEPGMWQIVKSFPDFRVQLVTSGEDWTIQYVTAFPGVR